jgi:hypothetical protein
MRAAKNLNVGGNVMLSSLVTPAFFTLSINHLLPRLFGGLSLKGNQQI